MFKLLQWFPLFSPSPPLPSPTLFPHQANICKVFEKCSVMILNLFTTLAKPEVSNVSLCQGIRELCKVSFPCKNNPNVFLNEKQVLSNLNLSYITFLNKNLQKVFSVSFFHILWVLLTFYAWHSFTGCLLSFAWHAVALSYSASSLGCL